ncbi:hypothetical protein DEQ92_14165 [Haloferax sp. Atlit-6N]|nr:hypothetical protein DEQ92_14165 [Haloferax sp. Atlit-6N]
MNVEANSDNDSGFVSKLFGEGCFEPVEQAIFGADKAHSLNQPAIRVIFCDRADCRFGIQAVGPLEEALSSIAADIASGCPSQTAPLCNTVVDRLAPWIACIPE